MTNGTEVHYLDTSALVKLVVEEDESTALRFWVARNPPVVTSDFTRTELMRAVARIHPDGAPRATALLESVQTVGLTRHEPDEAGRLGTPSLRSLNAIHPAVALAFGPDLRSIVTYDDRLAEAAVRAGMVVEAPRG